MHFDARYDSSASLCQIRKPRPPSFIGSDNISLSSPAMFDLNRAGIKLFEIVSSNGLSRSFIPMVRKK